MSLIKQISIGLLLLIGPSAAAQESFHLQDFIESLVENLPEDYDLSELMERFTHYQSQPLDLNHSNQEQLSSLLILSPIQINNLFTHIKQNGELIDLLELQGIDGFDLQTINRMLPFVCVKKANVLSNIRTKELFEKSRNELIIRYARLLHTQKGFLDLPGSRYLGTPDKLLVRYRYSYSDLSASVVAEKDAGETFFNSRSGVDHLSGNISLMNSGKIKKLIIGDYSLQFGQGLSMSSGFALGKGAEVTSVGAKELGIRPYASSNEATFFRGIGSTVGINKQLDITGFLSFRKLDASLKLSEDGEYTLQNINKSGLHRTVSELKNQKSLSESVYGAAIHYVMKDFRLGAAVYLSKYDNTFTTGNLLYNQFSFTGKQLSNASMSYSNTWRNVYIFGEAAHSIGSGWAFINGIMAAFSGQLSIVFVHRDYKKNYHSFYGNALGEGAETSNENGWYMAVNYSPGKKWLFSVYGDYFHFPWARYRVDTASSGYEGFGQISYTPEKKNRFLFRYKREIKSQNPDAGTGLKGLQKVLKENYRIDANWSLNKKLSFQQRIELAHYQKNISKEWGCMVYSDLNYKPLSSKVTGNVRFAYFRTGSYNDRIYAYEDDVLYASGFGIYYGKGMRSFINLRYHLRSGIDLFCRYALSFYPGQKNIGSGLDEISGDRKSDLKVQIRYQF